MTVRAAIAVAALSLLLAPTAMGAPVEFNPTVDNTPSGTYSQIGPLVLLGDSVTAGYVVATNDMITQSDQTDWLWVLTFPEIGVTGLANTGQVDWNGCNLGAGNISCFPSYATVTSVPNIFIPPGSGDSTDYEADETHTYRIHDDLGPNGSQVPEPSSFALAGLGGAAIGLWGKRRTT